MVPRGLPKKDDKTDEEADDKTIEKLKSTWHISIWITLIAGFLLILTLFIFNFGNRDRAYHYVLMGVYMFVSAFVIEIIIEGFLLFRKRKEKSSKPTEKFSLFKKRKGKPPEL